MDGLRLATAAAKLAIEDEDASESVDCVGLTNTIDVYQFEAFEASDIASSIHSIYSSSINQRKSIISDANSVQGVYDSDDSDNEKSISAKDVDDLALLNPHTDFFGVSEIKLDTKDVGIVNIRILLEQKNRDTAEKIRQVFELPFLDHYRGEYSCWLIKSVMLKGHVFLTDHHVCFYASLPRDQGTIFKSGFLAKKSRKRKQFHTSWFIIRDTFLNYYENSRNLYFPLGSISLESIVERKYSFLADSKQSQLEWKKAIEAAVFRAKNVGDFVRIVLPFASILESKQVQSSLFSDAIMLKVVDTDDDTISNSFSSTDEFYFAFFSNAKKSFEHIRQLKENARSQASNPAIHKLRFSYEDWRVANSDATPSDHFFKKRFSPPCSPSASSFVSPAHSLSLPPSPIKLASAEISSPLSHADFALAAENALLKAPNNSWSLKPWPKHRKTTSEGSISSFFASQPAAPPNMQNLREQYLFPHGDKSILGSFICYMVSNVLPKIGRLCLSENHLSFRSKLIGVRSKALIPLDDIEGLCEEKASLVFYHGLYLRMKNQSELWFEFHSSEARNKCFRLLSNLCRNSTTSSTTLNSSTSQFPQLALDHSSSISDAAAHGTEDAAGGLNGCTKGPQQYYPTSSHIASSLTTTLLHEIHSNDSNFCASLNNEQFYSLPPIANSTETTVTATSSLHITCVTIGTRGDVQPFIALCKGLMKHGHTCRLATHEEYRDWIESHGIEFRRLGGNPAELMKLCVDNGMFSISFFREAASKLRQWIDDLLVTTWDACQGTDVVIESAVAMGGFHVAEKLGVPFFRAFTMPWTRTRDFPHPFASSDSVFGGSSAYNSMTWVLSEGILWKGIQGQVNRFRKRHLQLPPIHGSFLTDTKTPFLYCFSASIVRPPSDWHSWIHLTGFWFLDQPNPNWTCPQALRDFIAADPDNKPVYIGFGSVIVQSPESLLQCIVAAVQKAGVRAVLSKGWSARSVERAALSENDCVKTELSEEENGQSNASTSADSFPSCIYSIDHVPHDWLFPQMAGVVHHGGAGTTAAGIRAGVPTIIKPFFGDQFFWAERVQEMGVGVGIRKPQHFDADVLAASLTRITTDDKMAARARLLGEKIRGENGVDVAVQILHRDVSLMRDAIRARQQHLSTPNNHHHHRPLLSITREVDISEFDGGEADGGGLGFDCEKSPPEPHPTSAHHPTTKLVDTSIRLRTISSTLSNKFDSSSSVNLLDIEPLSSHKQLNLGPSTNPVSARRKLHETGYRWLWTPWFGGKRGE